VANFPAFERSEIDDAVRVQATTQLVTLVVASLLGLGLAGRVLRPLRSLAGTARMISDTDFAQRIPVRGRDEASLIATAFNDMLGRLERAFTTQRRFLDDASHELRAPLTVIRGHLELLELDTDPEDRRATGAVIIDEIDRMNRIVDDLLVLARAEQPDFVRVQQVDLHGLTTDIHRKASALAPRDWRIEPPAHAAIRADPQRLTQAMVQLAQNACQHTDDGAVIRIGASVEDGRVRMWVHDDGRGVAPEDAALIFQRFSRGSRRNPVSGAGLGLSIVRAIAEAHGGDARLVDGPGAGARFELVIPTDSGDRPPVPPPDSHENGRR
jgi:signal transduction histidine kinase